MKIRVRESFCDVFPQANDIYRLYKLGLALFEERRFSKSDLIELIGVGSERQLQYYFSACEFIGLSTSDKTLSQFGKMVFAQDKNNIFILMVYHILSINIFADYFVNRNDAKSLHYLETQFNISKSTVPRRLSTLKRWINWCDIIIKDFQINIDWVE